jgi:hypothetical protein
MMFLFYSVALQITVYSEVASQMAAAINGLVVHCKLGKFQDSNPAGGTVD